MKLKKLAMTAFGSYGTKTVVDFADIDSGLYLIRGNTGAGKTTIFDAVVFAFYGESSGGKRTLAMMHSDFVPMSVPTEIELVFEHNGGEHVVRRVQAFTHHRNGSYSPATPTAEFREAGRPVIQNSKTVTARIVELLGLTGEQFCQIVMLAQGEFRRFLEADGKGRLSILSKIFDTASYRALTDRLERAEKKLYTSRRDDEEAVRLEIQNLELPADLPPERVTRLKPVDLDDREGRRVLRSPTIEADLSALVAEEADQAARLRAEHASLRQTSERLMAEWKSAEAQNGRLDACEQARKDMDGLESQRPGMEEKDVLRTRGRHALTVRGEEEKLLQAQNAVSQSERTLVDLTEKVAQCEKAAQAAAIAVEALAPRRQEVEDLGTRVGTLRETLPSYERLTQAERSLEALNGRRGTAQAELDRLNGKVDAAKAALRETTEGLKGLETAEAELVQAENERSAATGLREAFGRILAGVDDYRRDAEICEEMKRAFVASGEEAKKAQAAYQDVYRRFVDGQAGILADTLRRDIVEKGAGRCPVCGAVHASETADFAVAAAMSCTEADVKTARADADRAEAARAAHETRLAVGAAKLEQMKAGLLQSAMVLDGCADMAWEVLSDAARAAELQRGFAERELVARKRVAAARDAKVRRDALLGTQAEETAAIQELNAGIEQAGKAVAELATALSAEEATIATLRGQLAFADEQAAREELARQEKVLAALRAEIAAADQGKIQVDRDLAAALARSKQESDALDKRREASAACAVRFLDARVAEGYADAASYAADRALLPDGAAPAQRWLADLDAVCASYRARCESQRKILGDLEEETKNFVRRDVAAAQSAYETAKTAEDEVNVRVTACESLTERHRNVLEKIRETDRRLGRTDAAMKRLHSLAALATGGYGQGTDRLDFERYMLGDCLQEVLQQANVRLDTMSGGRYELVHRVEGLNRQAVAGLDIDVLDHNTGRQRLSQTISGGEGFQASMALALGLADVVRNRAGNVQLDSTFIDEGFGSLDEDVLRKCLEVLKDLARGERQVGIISHVAELEADVWPQIVVTADEKTGSSVHIEKR